MRILFLCAASSLLLAGCDVASGVLLGRDEQHAPPALHQANVERATPEGTCLPANVEPAPIVAFGAYEGARQLGVRLGENTHETTLISVGGSRHGEDHILLLMAYEPTVWDFSAAPIERINAVIVSGYHNQAVSNLPPTVPVVLASQENGRNVCRRPGYAYEGGPKLDHVAQTIAQATGQEIISFEGIYSARSVVLGQVLSHRNSNFAVNAGEIRASVRVTPDPVAPREEGLAELERRELIRPARQADIDRWNRLATQRLRTGHLATFRSDFLQLHNSYVVLGTMTAPAGMYGAHSRNFLLAPGVPMPEDRGSHNTYYDLDDGSCLRGPACHELGQRAMAAEQDAARDRRD